jgi:hypothetical protein
MSINSRVAQIEKELGASGGICACEHPGSSDVRHYPGEWSEQDADADTRPPNICAICGKEKRVIKVLYVKKWKGANDEPAK